MLPSQFSSDLYALDYKRSLRRDERRFAYQLLAATPQRILHAGAWLAFPWLVTLLLCTGPRSVSALLPTPLFAATTFFWLAVLVVATILGVCEFIDLTVEAMDARTTLSISHIEVWERIPLTLEETAELDYLPNRVEVIAGTAETWNQEWDRDAIPQSPLPQLVHC